MGFKEKYLESTESLTLEKPSNQIVVYNDDVNTFDHVIETLVSACEHSYIQAEQCSLIVHNNGKCTVKSGDFDDLKPRYEKIVDAGITAEII